MTNIERQIAGALGKCRFLPGTFDKRFVNQLPNWVEREMTEKGRDQMIAMLHKYRRQIPNYEELKALI
jgi:hypothetical protein